MTSKGHERREEEEERNSWGLEFTWTSLSPCYTGSPVIVFVSSFFFSKEQQFALHVQTNSVCSVLALPCIVQEMGGWGGGGFIMSRERVMVCAGHLLVISRSAHPGVLFNK